MGSFTVTKRKIKSGYTWQYDVHHKALKSGRKKKSGFDRKNDAQYAAMKLLEELDKGIEIDKDKTFKDYYNKWIELNNKDKLSIKQKQWYERSLRLFVDYFGDNKTLRSITRQDYQAFLNEYGKGRTSETVRKVHGCIKSCIKDAVYDGYIQIDPTYKVSPKGTKDGQEEDAKFMKIQEYLDLIDYFKTKDSLSYIFLYLLAITGARFNEINQLKMSDIDYNKGLIHLRGTKTKNADRYVEVNKEDIKLVQRKLLNHPTKISGILFDLSHNAVKKSYNKSKQAINMKDEHNVSTYALRHTHCSYLISRGIPIEYISKRLGHANISITLDFYAHLLEEHKKEQGQRVRELFSSN